MIAKGLYLLRKNNRNILMFDGKEISSTTVGHKNSSKVYVKDNKLYIDGEVIAVSNNIGSILVQNSSALFNEVNLLSEGTCINITLADYEVLFKGGYVKGYKTYNSSDIYNIVDNVAESAVITYTRTNDIIEFSNNVTGSILNNVIHDGEIIKDTVNVLDDDKNINIIDAPFVCVKYFNPIIEPGSSIAIDYYVDARGLPSLNNGDVSESFTVVVKIKDGSTIVSKTKTTYAGKHSIITPIFETTGETWLSIECIDSRGVGSIVQYFDIMVRTEPVPNYYTMQESDLTTYGIAINDNTVESALNNKAALTNFFAAVKAESANYNGVIMLKGIYYIDYHAVNGYGTQTYSKMEIDPSTRKVTSIIDNINEEDVLESGVQTTYHDNFSINSTVFKTADGFNKAVTDKFVIVEDGKYYIFHVNNTSTNGDDIEFPNNFTVDLNGSTIQAIPSTDLSHGVIVKLNNNVDTHIINGNIVGNYKDFDFRLTAIRIGYSNPSEWLHPIFIYCGKYCSFENLDISNFVGYGSNANGVVGIVDDEVIMTFSSCNSIDSADGSIELDYNFVSTQFINITGRDEISVGRHGYGGYSIGARREIFYVFYVKEDETYTYLTTIKSKFYYQCKVPQGATHVKVIGYGTTNDYPLDVSGSGRLAFWRSNGISKNNVISKCTWHDTRTCAVNPCNVKGLLYNECHFKNVAKETVRPITKMLGDLEDGFQSIQNVAFINCDCVKGTGKDNMYIHYCNGLTFDGNTGITLQTHGGVEYGFVVNNVLPSMEIEINNRCQYPFVIYNNNKIDNLEVEYDSTTIFDNEVEQKPQPYVEMDNTSITDTCHYPRLNLHNSMNGDKWYA